MPSDGRRASHATGGAPAVRVLAGVAVLAAVFVWLTVPRPDPETYDDYPRRGVDTSYVWPVVSRTIVVQPEDLDRERPP